MDARVERNDVVRSSYWQKMQASSNHWVKKILENVFQAWDRKLNSTFSAWKFEYGNATRSGFSLCENHVLD